MPARRNDQPGLAARFALRAIRSYQRHLSPRKGFTCAHRGATGGDSCSTYGYRVVKRCGLRIGLRLLRRRLNACGSQQRFGGGPLSYQHGDCDPGIDADCCGDVLSSGCDLSWMSKKKQKSNSVEFDALRARVEAAKRKNAKSE
jgi:putative component of membrane protein insertase Oxa1/YidC/SpoIIIJ protein YidD